MTKHDGPSSRSPDRRVTPFFLKAGPVLLFVLAATYGNLERHHSNDTWIALAAGRQIVDELGHVPKIDTFSYTFNGKPWFNQNWLSHVMYYWLYSRIAPDAAVYGKYVICAAMFLLMLAAARARSRSWTAALIGTAIVSAASLRWLSPRPESSGFLCMAGLMACLAWLSHPDKKRVWPALLLLPWFVLWGCAHGSFIFGYGMIIVFLGCWAVTRLVRPTATLTSDRQVVAIVVCTAAAVVITIMVSPFGVENFTHPFKVAESEVFRQVSEWRPPYVTASFPPALPFWVALSTGVAALAMALAARSAWAIEPKQRKTLRPPTPWGLFDLAAVAIGLYMAMWARRFAPILYIVALPSLLVLIARLAWPIPRRVRDPLWTGLAGVSWVGALALAVVIVWHVNSRYTAPYRSRHSFDPDRASFNLLERTIQYDQSPGIAIEFLKRNNFQAHLVTHWVYAGPVMFHAPGVKVYIDGRSQQVYSEEHYMRFQRFWVVPPQNLPADKYEAYHKQMVQRLMRMLDEFDTDAVMLRLTERTRLLLQTVDTSPQWVLTLYTGSTHLFLRRGSDMLARVLNAERQGRLWWPELPEAMIARAHLWLGIGPAGLQKSLSYFRAAVDGRPRLGFIVYPRMVDLWLRMGRPDLARQYLREQVARINDPDVGLSDGIRRNLLNRIEQLRQAVGRREAPGPATPRSSDTEQEQYWWR